MEKMIELDGYENTAIYKVPLDEIIERDKNANVMEPRYFLRLIENIKHDKRLESLPFGHLIKKGERTLFEIISGHHRVRAARNAGREWVYCLVCETTLPEDEVKSKQLAHNRLHGYDDPQIAREIYESIMDVDGKIATGYDDRDFNIEYPSFSGDSLNLDFEMKQLTLLFLPSEIKDLDRVFQALTGDYEALYAAHITGYNSFIQAIARVGEEFKIKSISSQLAKMVDIVNEVLDGTQESRQSRNGTKDKVRSEPD